MDLTHARGINFRQLDEAKIAVGIRRDELVEYLNSIPTDEKGWLNFDLIRNPNPELKRGYSHFMKLLKK